MKLFHILTASAVFAALSAGSAFAADSKASQSSISFVHKASEAGEFEIESSKVALQKSQNSNVKQFAQQMVDDHSKANAQLKDTLPSSTVDPSVATDKLNSKHQQILDSLKSASGSDFDTKYIAAQTDAHKEAVSLFQDYAKNGDDPALKSFANKTLPTLEQHLQHVKQLKAAS